MTTKIIGYIRVSTAKQGESGLGLEAQVHAIDTYARQNAGEIVQTYRDVETGKVEGRECFRPELLRAIAHAKRIKAKLVIAKLDRLARDVHFVSGLMKDKVDFVACDNPTANAFTIHILAAMAEHEARMISERTKAALQAAKARGVLLGSARPGAWIGQEDVRLAALAKGRQTALDARRKASAATLGIVVAKVKQWRSEGRTLTQIAIDLNAAGHLTVQGSAWLPMSVSRVLAMRL